MQAGCILLPPGTTSPTASGSMPTATNQTLGFNSDFEAIEARRMLPRFNAENFSKNVDLVKIFENLAAKKGATPSQVVLAWILAQGQEFFPISGTKNLKYLEQNLGALKVVITPEHDAQIRKTIKSMGVVAGEQLPAGVPGSFAITPQL